MNWINKVIEAGKNIKRAIHKRATKEDIANSDWISCCKGPQQKIIFENNMWVCPDCNRHHRIKPKQRFDYLFGKGNYEIFKTPIPNDDPLNWTDSKSYKDRLKSARKKTGMECGMMVASGTIDGIKTPEDAKKMANTGPSGVIVGSAFVKYIQDNLKDKELPQNLGKYIKSFVKEL